MPEPTYYNTGFFNHGKEFRVWGKLCAKFGVWTFEGCDPNPPYHPTFGGEHGMSAGHINIELPGWEAISISSVFDRDYYQSGAFREDGEYLSALIWYANITRLDEVYKHLVVPMAGPRYYEMINPCPGDPPGFTMIDGTTYIEIDFEFKITGLGDLRLGIDVPCANAPNRLGTMRQNNSAELIADSIGYLRDHLHDAVCTLVLGGKSISWPANDSDASKLTIIGSDWSAGVDLGAQWPYNHFGFGHEEWQSSTPYAFGDYAKVRHGGDPEKLWEDPQWTCHRCIDAHTSGDTFDEDAEKWESNSGITHYYGSGQGGGAGNYSNAASRTWVDAYYTRSPASPAVPTRILGWENDGAYHRLIVGAGIFRLTGGSKPGGQGGGGGANFIDHLNRYFLWLDPDYKDMGSEVQRTDLCIRGYERHPRVVEQEIEAEEGVTVHHHHRVHTWPEPWKPDTVYVEGDEVCAGEPEHVYVCAEGGGHTSEKTWEEEDPADWTDAGVAGAHLDILGGYSRITYDGAWWAYGSATMPPGSSSEVYEEWTIDTPQVFSKTTAAMTHGNLRVQQARTAHATPTPTEEHIGTEWHIDDPPADGEKHWHEQPVDEPSHPAWEPLPEQAVDEYYNPLYDPDTGEPLWAGNRNPVPDGPVVTNYAPWQDDAVHLGFKDNYFDWANALRVQIKPPGIVATPFQAADYTDEEWEVVDGTIEISGGYLKVIPDDEEATPVATLPEAILFPEHKRLTGAAFAWVYWATDTSEAEAKVSFGGHTWNLKAGYLDAPPPWIPDHNYGDSDFVMHGGHYYECAEAHHSLATWELDEGYWGDCGLFAIYQCTEIDLCRPDSTTVTNPLAFPQQSIVPWELPHDRSYPGDPEGTRYADSHYNWQFPKGWGVGRLKDCKFEAVTPGMAMWLGGVSLRRKPAEEGGFAAVYVMPHQSAWPDTRDHELDDLHGDFAWPYSGDVYIEGVPAPHTDHYRVVPKVLVVVDGAVIWEGPCGHVQMDNRPAPIGVPPNEVDGPFYWRELYHLSFQPWAVGLDYKADPPSFVITTSGQYKCILDHTAEEANKPPNATYWVLQACLPTGYPLDNYTTPTGYLTNGMLTLTSQPSGGHDLIFAWSLMAFLVPGIYNLVANSVQIPMRLKLNTLVVETGSYPFGIPYVDSSQLTYKGQLQALVWNNGVRANLASVKIEQETYDPDDPDPNPTVTYGATNGLGWLVSPPLKTQYAGDVSGVGGSPIECPVRNRLYSRVCIDMGAGLGKGLACVTGQSRTYVLYGLIGGLRLRIYDHHHTEYIERGVGVITDTGAGIAINEDIGRVPLIVVVYDHGGQIKRLYSGDDGKTWSAPVSVTAGTYPQLCASPVDAGGGIEILVYLNASNNCCVRRKLGTGDWGSEIPVAAAVAGDTATVTWLKGQSRSGEWLVFLRQVSDGAIRRYKSLDNGRTWAISE